MERVAVLGTGLLGAGFVEGFRARGTAVSVWNRTREKAAALAGPGVEVCETPGEAVTGVDRVHLVLSSDAAVDLVVASFRRHLVPGIPVFDHSTNAPARAAARQAELRADGVPYFAAPVFMAPGQARAATGLMLVAGPEDEVGTWRTQLEAMTGHLWHIGDDAARATGYKLLGNAVLVALTGMMGDTLALGDAMGFSPEETLALFERFRPDGALLARGRRVAEREGAAPSFTMAMARKDVQLMLDAAGGPEGLVVLPHLAAAMDAQVAAGRSDEDYARFAWTRPRR